ncbi:MAG: sigma-70 family RNA polymerase sigma factor [Anaerolineae bacterium]|nr:sigma-70 family RNA polymerase sigma factor [Anaerolineae bacterium]
MLTHNFLGLKTTIYDERNAFSSKNFFSNLIELVLGQKLGISTGIYRFSKRIVSQSAAYLEDPEKQSQSKEPKFDEKAILKKLASLDPEIVTQVHDHFYPDLYRYAHYRLSDPTLAQDLVSEVFLHLLEAVHKGRGPKNTLRGWMMGTLSNLVNSHYRNAYKKPTEALSDTFHADTPGPANRLEISLKEATVRAALQKLTPDQQNVLALRFGSEYSLQETANVIGKQVNAVKQLQFRALESLRRHLGDEES